jgi:WD40 repeat protein
LISLNADFHTDFALDARSEALAIGRPTGTVELWNLRSGRQIDGWRVHEQPVTAVAFSGNRGQLATGSTSGDVSIWDLRTKSQITNILGFNKEIRAIAYSPDENLIAAAGDGGYVTWSVGKFFEVMRWRGDGASTTGIAFSPDSRTVAFTLLEANEVQLWDCTSGKRTAVLRGLTGGAYGLAFSPDGRSLAALGLKVKMWNVSTLQEVGEIEVGSTDLWTCAFSPDGRAFYVGWLEKRSVPHVTRFQAPALGEIDAMSSIGTRATRF